MIKLYRGDCLKILRKLDAGSIDAVVTDPPYGIDYWHSGGGHGVSDRWPGAVTRQARKPIHGDTLPFDPSPWLEWRCLFWGANHFAKSLPDSGSWLSWDKSCGKGPADSFIDGDFAWTSVPSIKRNVCRFLWKGVAAVKAGEDNARRYHPMQKPVGLMLWCFEVMGLQPGQTVLDPYMGAGSTALACQRAGLNFIGMEIDPVYHAIAKRRIKAEQKSADHPASRGPAAASPAPRKVVV